MSVARVYRLGVTQTREGLVVIELYGGEGLVAEAVLDPARAAGFADEVKQAAIAAANPPRAGTE